MSSQAAKDGVDGLLMNPAGFTYAGYALRDCIRAVALPVLRHRIVVNFHAEAQAVNADDLARRLLDSVQPDGADA